MKKVLFSLVLASVLPCTALAQNLTEEDVKLIVSEYVKNNGEELSNSINNYIIQKKREMVKNVVRMHSPISGNPDSDIVFVEFSDFRCGYCRKSQDVMSELRRRYGDRVKFVFKHFPALGVESGRAAIAVLAAHKQGKFKEYSAKIWENQQRLGEDLYIRLAKELNLNVKQFNEDRESEVVQNQLAQDAYDGEALGMEGVPNFFIGAEKISGARPIEDFVRLIEAELANNQ